MSKFIGILTILIGGAIAIGPFTFAPVCKGMVDSDPVCHKTRIIALAIGVVVLLIGIILFMLKNKVLAGLFSVLVAAGGIATILNPILIAPVCETSTMSCHVNTLPFLLVSGCLLTVIGILTTVYMFKSRKPKAAPEEEPAPAVRPESVEEDYYMEDLERRKDWPDYNE